MLYITFTQLYAEGMEGVRDKVFSQTAAFERRIGNIRLTYLICGMVNLLDNQIIVDKRPAATRKQLYSALRFWIEKYNIDMTYVRIPPACDFYFLDFMRYQKEKGIKTVVEIPTYPYDGEGIDNREHREDVITRELLKDYTHYIATSSNEKSIWGIPCIKISNGVNIEDYEFKNNRNLSGKVVMTAMASSFIWWNGFERIIEGLNIYYANAGNRDIELVFIGAGGDEEKYKKLVKDYELDKRVFFRGKLSDDEIDRALSDTDIAVSSLGRHRSGIGEIEPIRGAVYAAKGLPIIGDYIDPRFTSEYKYYKRVSYDEKPIDIPAILSWYDSIKDDVGYRKKIREYAERRFTWDNTMRGVIEYFLNSSE